MQGLLTEGAVTLAKLRFLCAAGHLSCLSFLPRDLACVPRLGAGGHRHCRGPRAQPAREHGPGRPLQKEKLQTGLRRVRDAAVWGKGGGGSLGL